MSGIAHDRCRKGHLYTPETTYTNPNSGDRRCLTCANSYAKEYAGTHGEERRQRSRNYYRNNPAKNLAASKQWRLDNPEKKKQCDRTGLLRREYGLSMSEYNQMISDAGGLCALCCELSDKLYVDHNHTTGKVRGLVCSRCNMLMGHLETNGYLVQRALVYITTRGV